MANREFLQKSQTKLFIVVINVNCYYFVRFMCLYSMFSPWASKTLFIHALHTAINLSSLFKNRRIKD